MCVGAASHMTSPLGSSTGTITVDLGRIASNWKALAAKVAPAQCAAVVKANAYGLGADRVIPALAHAGCTTFFIATPSEAEHARRLAPKATIYALDGLVGGNGAAFAELGVRPLLSTLDDVAAWAALAKSRNGRLPAGLHIDSGLHRLGLETRDVRRLAANALKLVDHGT